MPPPKYLPLATAKLVATIDSSDDLPVAQNLLDRNFIARADMRWQERIEVNPSVLVGKPIIRGTRISVELIMDRMADGWSMEDVLAAYPRISREDVLAALSFAAEIFKEETFVASDI